MSFMVVIFFIPFMVEAQLVDRVLADAGGHLVTLTDVRAVRDLELLPPASEPRSQDALVRALVDRRLMLNEIERFGVPPPAEARIRSRHDEWVQRLGRDVGPLLERHGWTDGTLDGWIRDDLLIEAYLDLRFGEPVPVSRDEALRYYTEHPAEFVAGGAPRPFAEVEADLRRRIGVQARRRQIDQWVEGLRQRASIR